MPSILRTAALATLLLVSSCHRPEIGIERARDYFEANRAAFDAVVEQVERCQPDGGRLDAESAFQCRSAGASPRNVLSAMDDANAQWIRVNYNHREGEQRGLGSILIAMPSSYGVSFAGVIEAFVYETEAAANASYERKDYGDAFIERLPVTKSPHHWYWQKISR